MFYCLSGSIIIIIIGRFVRNCPAYEGGNSISHGFSLLRFIFI